MRTLKRRGLVYRATEIILPLATVARKLHLYWLLTQGLIASILLYQRFLSPHKGFTCTYRRLHQEASCSEYFRQVIQTKGLATAIPLFQQRLIACKVAKQTLCYQSLSQQLMANERRRRKKRSSNGDDGVDVASDGCNDSCSPCDCSLGGCGDADCDGTPDCLEGCNGCDACSSCDCDCG